MNDKLFSVTKKDFDIQTFRSGGKGGQHQNKRDSGVRIRHSDSGAVGESREERSQHRNRAIAFHRLVNHPDFQKWIRSRAIEIMSHRTIEERVEALMKSDNIKVEVKNEDGKWVEWNE